MAGLLATRWTAAVCVPSLQVWSQRKYCTGGVGLNVDVWGGVVAGTLQAHVPCSLARCFSFLSACAAAAKLTVAHHSACQGCMVESAVSAARMLLPLAGHNNKVC